MPLYVINGADDTAKEVDADTWTIRDGYFQFARTRSDGFADQIFAIRVASVETVEMKPTETTAS